MNKSYIDIHGYKRLVATHGLVHRIIASAKFSRALMWFEVVHHIDENKLNNHPNNLFVCSKDFHELIHTKGIKKDVFWDFVKEKRERNSNYYRHNEKR